MTQRFSQDNYSSSEALGILQTKFVITVGMLLLDELGMGKLVIIKKISELPTCQCIELVEDISSPDKSEDGDKTKTGKKRTKLELAVQSALEAAKDVLRPPTPPPPPPAEPLPPREAEIPITAGAPGSEGDSSGTEEPGDPQADPVEVPTSEEPNTGRTIQRTLAGHRLWRFTPFNFEKYPGMRMNVPPDKTAWTVSIFSPPLAFWENI
ncbi:unnamed protein product [Dibothriocephalus latus]|uniref:Uncharacterized protein n=1 Tax=Dibothriocephalus latus TaxID=60516 RepID=A0A3P7M147_DIBLA|nr:unnamed protein product [Dibothriocephalus latus]